MTEPQENPTEKPKGLFKIALLVLLYLVSPLDILPEAMLGPLGFVDDAALLAYLLKRFLQR